MNLLIPGQFAPTLEVFRSARYSGDCTRNGVSGRFDGRTDGACCAVAGLFGDSERNWSEDSGHENGNYGHVCRGCGQSFVGHKRRPNQCRKCSLVAKAKWDAERAYQRGTWGHCPERVVCSFVDRGERVPLCERCARNVRNGDYGARLRDLLNEQVPNVSGQPRP